jgi:hypothetical protein
MRTPTLTVVAILLLVPPAADAQLTNHSIGLELGIASLSGFGLEPHIPLGFAASYWLDGRISATARLAMAFPARTGDRTTAYYVCGAAGLRLDLSTSSLRPWLFAEVGWYQIFLPDAFGSTGAFAPGAGAGLEWFFERDLSLALVATGRWLVAFGRDGGRLGELTTQVSAYF